MYERYFEVSEQVEEYAEAVLGPRPGRGVRSPKPAGDIHRETVSDADGDGSVSRPAPNSKRCRLDRNMDQSPTAERASRP